MSDFHSALLAAGLTPKEVVADGRWRRCATVDKPRRKNGSYLLMPGGRLGFWQNHRTDEEVVVWRDDTEVTPAQKRDIERQAREAERERAIARANAARLAAEIVGRCTLDHHPYLDRKGLPNEMGLVDYDGRLVVPMRPVGDYAHSITSVQWISSDGSKMFLKDGAAGGAAFMLGNGVDHFLCEGYATALSVRAALASLYRPGKVVVTFSAGNLKTVAAQIPGRRYVIADNDESGVGERFARATGVPWCMPPDVGDDANDLHRRHGLRALAEMVRRLVIGA